MNKRILVLLVTLATVIGLYFLLNRNTGNTIDKKEKDFKVKDVSNIDRVFITNVANKQYALLEKTPEGWIVNKKYPADVTKLEIILETFRKIEVKAPVAESMLFNVKKQLVVRGTKCELYRKGVRFKTVYIGGPSASETGTFMYLEGAEAPYICHIPGFQGYLSTRFVTDEKLWRSKQVFGFKSDELASVTAIWPETPNQNFAFNNSGKEPLLLNANPTGKEINMNLLRSYLSLWDNLCYEGFIENLSPEKIDSIASSKPYLILTAIGKNNKTKTLTIYRKGIQKDSEVKFDEYGIPLQYEQGYYYAFIDDNRREIVQIQDFVFGKVMKGYSDFLLQ